MDRVKILNIEMDNFTLEEMLEHLTAGAVFTPNVNHMALLQHSEAFYRAYQSAEYRVCDGQVIYLLSRLLGTPFKARVSGSELFPRFCKRHCTNEAIRIFLLGGREGSGEAIMQKLNAKAGRSLIVGAYAPPFGFEHDEIEMTAILERVRQSGATVLAVALGAPKQELFIATHRANLPMVHIFFAIGATLDFEAGVLRPIPPWLMATGLGFLSRLASEPRRLWRRYLIEAPPFFWLVLKQRFGVYRNPFANIPCPKIEQAQRLLAVTEPPAKSEIQDVVEVATQERPNW